MTYYKELYIEIRKRLIKLAVFTSLLLILALTVFFLFLEKYQIESDTKEALGFYTTLKADTFELLHHMNQEVVPHYMDGQMNERQFYTSYYEKNTQLPKDASLMVMEESGNILLATNDTPAQLSTHYLKIVTDVNKGNDVVKVQRGLNGERYMLFFSKVPDRSVYSILIFEDSLFTGEGLTYGTKFIISDKYNNVFVKNTTLFDEKTAHKIDATDFNYPYMIANKELYLTTKKQMDDTIYLYTFLMTFPLPSFLLFMLLTTIVLLLLFSIQSNQLAGRIAKKNTEQIEALVDQMARIKAGDTKQILMSTNREFQFLIDNINELVQEKERLMNQQMTLERQNHFYEKKVLESQFNSHFIYNTLEAIRVTSHFDPGVADKLILSLNRVLRYSAGFTSTDTTLEKDLSIIEDFLQVNLIRFDQFHYEITLEPGIEDLSIPKLFLLPIVENALKYGMQDRDDLTLSIQCYCDEQWLYFDVKDNGPGFSIESLWSIDDDSYESTHHGLINSYKRLKISYPGAKMTVTNQEEGALVRFKIPKGEGEYA